MEDITIENAKGELIAAEWTTQNPLVYSEQIQARAMQGRNGTRIDIRQWKDDNVGGYKGPTKAGFNLSEDLYPKWRDAMLRVIEAVDVHLGLKKGKQK
ncbi:MAG: hypothetical protein GTO54_12630 [Nitrososphaeria archaeon]|nr:hypothetical protein [Nitrososphaeria archaeon]